MKTVSVQELNGSFFAYLPKVWVTNAGIQKGDKISWIIEEGDHRTLKMEINSKED
ncbi:hypothetical protein [Methanobacterium subterraneum]|uniref:AbrB/MazE/SpoVT family DNA-binding domain-containing protein n=1 Tax=Methanobacterium subterraneum TaxID=59277 RepID=A0A7K4DNB7_9EURY|nr:hypothetical protein [Methanobacterium subterraneum]NMO09506.1 hypothetical protein [Methanobacterium subterraneum]